MEAQRAPFSAFVPRGPLGIVTWVALTPPIMLSLAAVGIPPVVTIVTSPLLTLLALMVIGFVVMHARCRREAQRPGPGDNRRPPDVAGDREPRRPCPSGGAAEAAREAPTIGDPLDVS